MKTNFRYESERDGKKKQNFQETVEYILNKGYGETLTNEELSKKLGYNLQDGDEKEILKYRSSMGRIKNILLNYGYVLRGVSGIGYFILKPSQVSRHCYKTYINSARRLFDKSDFVLERTEKTKMDKDRQEEIYNMIELNKRLINDMDKIVTQSAYYSRKQYYDNLKE